MDDKHIAPHPPAGVPTTPQPPAGVLSPYTTGPNPSSPPPQKKTWPQIVAIIAAVIGIAAILVTITGFLSFASAFSACSRSLSDAPIGDSAETQAFLNDPVVTDRDRETFDILRGEFEDFYLLGTVNSNMNATRKHEAEALAAVDAYRAQLESGSWPSEDAQPDWVSTNRNPHMWVRLAQLAQDYIEEQTNESWRVVGIRYPFPSNGPIPVPATRDEQDCVVTMMACESGQDKDLVVPVQYYRWASPAYFTCSLDEYRADLQEHTQSLEQILAIPLLQGRSCLYDPDGTLYLFSTGEDDSLRNPEQFTQLLQALLEDTDGKLTSLTLLEEGTPVVISQSTTPSLNSASLVTRASMEEAQNALLHDTGSALHFASADELFHQYVWSRDEQKQYSDISGYLVRDDHERRYSWEALQDAYAADENFARVVAEYYGTSEEQVIAFSKTEESTTAIIDQEWKYHLILPRGVLPETPQELEDTILELMHELWRERVAEDASIVAPALYLFVYVIEADATVGPDGPMSFNKLREEGLADPSRLGDYTPDLAYRVYMSVYGDEETPVEDGWHNDFGMDIEGPLTQQREWFLKQNGLL